MPSLALQYVQTSCAGGINQQDELINPKKQQCADARNVWAPNGRVETRPGYAGINFLGVNNTAISPWLSVTAGGGGAYSYRFRVAKKVSGVTTLSNIDTSLSLNSLAVGDYWYLGIYTVLGAGAAATTPIAARLGHFENTGNTTNSNASAYKAEYWNGVYWAALVVAENFDMPAATTDSHFGFTQTGLTFVPPNDWTLSTVTDNSGGVNDGVGISAYWLRFKIISSAFDASVTSGAFASAYSGEAPAPTGFTAIQFPTTKFYTGVKYIGGNGGGAFTDRWTASSLPFTKVLSTDTNTDATTALRESHTLGGQAHATFAIIPQFETAYVAYNNYVTTTKLDTTTLDWAPAQVEADETMVGTNAPFDRNIIAQLGAFPKANYVTYFSDQMWAAGIENEPYTIRWSASGQYFKVWPTLNFEYLMEDDNSPITGMAALGEHMVVFKQDSIWVMLDSGQTSDLALQTYVPKKVVSGVGCVANSSIQKIRGTLVFLAEDGIYAFDGTSNILKLSDAVNETVQGLSAGRRKFAASAHWKTRSLYMLSVTSSAASANDLTLVYDYKNGTWWIWDNIPAESWLVDENENDDEQIFFADTYGFLYSFAPGYKSDYGTAISSYVTTHRIGYGGIEKLRPRNVELICDNKSGTAVTVEVLVNDEPSGATTTLDFTDTAEKNWGSLSWDPADSTADNNWATTRRRKQRAAFRRDGDWYQVKVSQATKNQPLKLTNITVGHKVLGAR